LFCRRPSPVDKGKPDASRGRKADGTHAVGRATEEEEHAMSTSTKLLDAVVIAGD
jgi:hypothetical protein